MPSTVTSLTLIQKLQQPGHEEAWVRLSARYQPILLALVRRSGRPEDECDDLLQETLAVVFDKFRRGEYEPSKGRLKSWLMGIAVNKLREFRRKRARQNKMRVQPGSETGFWDRIPDANEVSDIFEQEWQASVLSEALLEVRRQVDVATFEASRLYAVEGHDPGDVAAQLGITREAVYNCKSRVMGRLRKIRDELDEMW